jgi:hypothetical protein
VTAVFLAEPEVLRRLVSLAMAGPPGPDRLPELPAAVAAYFLLDVHGREAPEPFLTRTLGRLLRHLDHDTEQRPVICRGRTRGRISWPATLQARYAQDFDPGRYVCREVRRRYDTPENQLVKLLVERLAELLRSLPDALRTGAGYLPETGGSRAAALSTASRLAGMEAAVARFRRSVYFREVTTPREITLHHLTRAETARLAEYVEAARAWRRQALVLAAPSGEELARIGRRVLLLPGHAGAAGEPWLRLARNLLQVEAAA